MSEQLRYRVKLDKQYVRMMDYRYLVECTEKESDFSRVNALMIKKYFGDRVELLKIIDKKYMEAMNK